MKIGQNVKVRRVPQKHGNRTPCMWGCGTWVLIKLSECRKCRRKRVHAGHKRIRKIERAQQRQAVPA
jgi:hypothetical protein